jgi:hypothetical protein
MDKSYPITNSHEHTHSLYIHCLDCNSFGIGFPTEFTNSEMCGNCQSSYTVKYYPSCCMVDAFEQGKQK